MSKLPKKNNITMVRGDTYDFAFTVNEEPDVLTCSCRETYDSKDYIFQRTLEDGIVKVDDRYVVTIDPENTAGLPAKKYVYDVEMWFGDTCKTIIAGMIFLKPDVTR